MFIWYFVVPKHSGLEHCVEAEDQYCMYKQQTLQQIEPLAPATLKTCHIKSPKVKDAKVIRPVHVLLSRIYPDFIQILSKFYLDKIRIR